MLLIAMLQDLTIISRLLLSVIVFIFIVIGSLNTIADVSRISKQIMDFYLRLYHTDNLTKPKGSLFYPSLKSPTNYAANNMNSAILSS
jgi:hypothetical protein